MSIDRSARPLPRRPSFEEAAVALMLRHERGDTRNLRGELRALAAARPKEARLWDAYSGGRRWRRA